MAVLLFVSFIAGVLTVLAPCILPLLPVIIGGSVSGGGSKHRPLVIIGSLVTSIVLFTILLKYSTALLGISQVFWSVLSGVILVLVAIAYIFPSLWARIPLVGALDRKSNAVLGQGFQKENLKGDIIIGAALGPVFSSCSPTYFVILATILPRSFGEGIIHLVVYALGLGLSLLAISLLGQRIIGKLGWAANPDGWFKKSIGVLFLLVGLFVMTGADKKVQTYLLENGLFDITKVETHIREKLTEEKKPAVQTRLASEGFLDLSEKESRYDKYKEIQKPSGFVNTDGAPVHIADYIGKKVILLDIMTYSCINCQRTFPYVTKWYEKYKDEGLIVIGIHTPEFSFEKVQKNVENAMREFGITFPVVLDNDYATWNAYGNVYWPRKYLIDIDGYIVYDHAGEGNYAETERAIQDALRERGARLGMDMPDLGAVENKPAQRVVVGTPEMYFGSDRNGSFLANGSGSKEGTQTFVMPAKKVSNGLYLGGTWNITPEYAEAQEDATVFLGYAAKDVYMVASSSAPKEVEVVRNGVSLGTITISDEKLYTPISGEIPGNYTLLLKVPKGVRIFTFTFG